MSSITRSSSSSPGLQASPSIPPHDASLFQCDEVLSVLAEGTRQSFPPSLVDRPECTLVVVDGGSERLLFMDICSHEIYDSIDLGHGDWAGVCIHRISSTEVLVAVSDVRLQIVKVFDMASKKPVRSIGESGGFLFNPYFLSLYAAAAAGTRTALLLVSNYYYNSIEVFDLESGSHIRSIGGRVGDNDQGQLCCPGAIAVWSPQDDDDPLQAQVVVADSSNHNIKFFRLFDGMYVRSIGDPGTGEQQLDYPWAMSIHRPAGGRDEEAVLVTAGENDGRIHVLSVVSGEYLRCLGRGVGCGVGQLSADVFGIAFYRPAGEAEEAATQVIISDEGNHRLQVFNLYTGEHFCSIGGEGDRDSGLFKEPCCMDLMWNDDSWNYVLK